MSRRDAVLVSQRCPVKDFDTAALGRLFFLQLYAQAVAATLSDYSSRPRGTRHFMHNPDRAWISAIGRECFFEEALHTPCVLHISFILGLHLK